MSDSSRSRLRPDEPVNWKVAASRVPESSKRRRAKALWAFVKIAGVAMSTIIAMAISGLAYWDAHQADISAALSLKQAYAEKVSYNLSGSGNSTQIVVRNQSVSPITNVMLEVTANNPYILGAPYIEFGPMPPCSMMTVDLLKVAQQVVALPGFPKPIAGLGIPEDLPIVTVYSLPIAEVPGYPGLSDFEGADGYPAINIQYLIFTDAGDLIWSRDDQGVLSGGIPAIQTSTLPLNNYLTPAIFTQSIEGLSDPINPSVQISFLNGCS